MSVPTVLTTDPLNAATDFRISSSIIFTFDTDIDSASVNSVSFFVFDPERLEAVSGGLVVSGKTITFTPNVQLLEDHRYTAVAVGLSSGAGSFVKSSTGDALADDFSIQFRTTKERFVPLEEITSRSDIESVAPIRAEPSPLVVTQGAEEPLTIVSANPASFSNIDPCITEVRVKFNKAPTGILTGFVDLDVFPILGIDEYVADTDSAGQVWPRDCAPTGVLNGRTPPDFGTPTGIFSVDGDDIVWNRGTGEPCFNYNEEVIFTLKNGLPAATGGTLESEASIVYSTTFWPLFVGSRFVRTEIGPLARSLSDDTINRVVHKNSFDAWEQAGRKFDADKPFAAVRRYTAFRSVIDLIDFFVLDSSVSSEQEKQLGDFRVRKGSKTPSKYDALVAKAEKELKELRWYRGQGRPRWVVKGVDAYNARTDLFMRTWDNLGWWPGHMIPIANDQYSRAVVNARAGDHHTSGSPGVRIVVGPNGGLFKCTQKSQS